MSKDILNSEYPCGVEKKDFLGIYPEWSYNQDTKFKPALDLFTTELKLAEDYRTSWKWDSYWEKREKQFEAEINNSDDTKANIKLQYDRNILEQNIGEEGLELPYKVESEGKTVDANSRDIWRFVLDYFMRKEKVLDERIDFKWDKWIYWTWILFSWIRITTTVNSKPSDDGKWDIFNTKFDTVTKTKYHIWIKNINVWDFFPIWQSCTSVRDLKRHIFREKLEYKDFVKRYGKKAGFKYVNLVKPVEQDETPEEAMKDNENGNGNNVYLFHYNNEITWDYYIIANRTVPIWVWKSITRDSKSPMDVCQQFKNRRSIFGHWIGYKTESLVRYMNNLFEIAFDKVYNASNPPVVVWNNGEIDWEIYLGWDAIQVLNTNGDAKDIQQLGIDWNISGHQAAIEMGAQAIVENTWIDPSIYSESLNWINDFVAWLREQSKKAKLLLGQVMQDVALGSALTKMLENLMDWWPSLYGDLIEAVVEGDKLKKINYSWVKIKDKRIIKSKKTKWELISFETEDAPGEEDWFDFTPWLFMDKDWNRMEMSIKVTTPSTETLLTALRKSDFTQYLQNLQTMKVLFPDQPLPISQEELVQLSASIYGYDAENFESQSNKTKNAKQVSQLLKTLAESNPSNPQGTSQEALPTNQENAWTSPQLPQG